MNKNIKIKKKFTFVYPDFEYSLTKKGVSVTPGGWYSEGIAQLASVIEEAGWEVDLIHLTKPISRSEFLKLLEDSDPDIIGFSVRTGVWRKAKEMIAWAGKLKRFIIAGSYHPTLWPEEVINWEGVDAICIGEGENPIKDLLKNFHAQKKLFKTGSVWIRDTNGKVHKNPVQNLVCDIDSLPIPKFEIFDFSKLLSSQIKTATIVITRGCPYNCTYCWNNYARSLYPNKQFYVRFRSPENAIKYIKKILKVYPELLSFRFQDDLWPFWVKNWFEEFSSSYMKQIDIRFECHLRADLLNEDIIKTLKKMKCFGIYFGVESGDEYIRNKILKRYMGEESLIHAFQTCKKYGIRTHAYNIVGIPHENMQRALNTVKLNAKLEPTDMFYFIFFPYAGTELSNIAKNEGFWNPEKPLDPVVNIEMPDFKRNRIRFANLYGRIFTRAYQFVFKANELVRKPFEKILDFLWLFPYWPFWLFNGMMLLYRKAEEALKSFIKAHFFQLYLVLKK
ncbi:B12-binding domain-containing radical SAM protein [Candidatus Dojkabacteria bacterium]|nr:B12-binding domain-containing radical SAM protein [Candidatus Dojkabacteria bacterium]